MAGFNYVEFIMELNESPVEVPDGMMVFAKIRDLDNELLVHKRRMIFVKGSAPEEAAKDLKEGDKLHVLGIPRIDLALISWRIKHAADRLGVLDWNLPYEIIVVGVYDH
jgi:hypothetical protein